MPTKTVPKKPAGDSMADYARDLEILLAEEKRRTARVLDRIDKSMSALGESRRILRRIGNHILIRESSDSSLE